MRVSAAILVVAVGLLTGCSLGPKGKLKTLVKEASSSAECEWGSSSFENDPKAWLGCWDHAHGSAEKVARSLVSRLSARGFDVAAVRDLRSIQLTAVRGTDTLCVDVLARGFVRGRNTAPSEVDIPAGEVLVDIWAAEPRDSARPRCAALPPFSD